jgi:membrane protease YdiL (CAAX protease family)
VRFGELRPVLIALAAAALVAISMFVGMRPAVAGTPIVFLAPLVVYLLLLALAVVQMRRDGTLSSMLRPRSGDLSFGALAAAMLYFAAAAGRGIVSPRGSVREAWIARIYGQIGVSPELDRQRVIFVSVAIIVVAALEEIAWRGFIFSVLEERLGTRLAWPATAVLYAVAHLPTLTLLTEPFAPPNPLVVLMALGCGLVWGLIVVRTGRLPVAILSHVLFTWVVIVLFPLW